MKNTSPQMKIGIDTDNGNMMESNSLVMVNGVVNVGTWL